MVESHLTELTTKHNAKHHLNLKHVDKLWQPALIEWYQRQLPETCFFGSFGFL